jgi:hypothetical protein
MSKQFSDVNCTYGAPMGRHGHGLIQNCEPRTVRVFAVNLNQGGYDDGGAYWGSRLAGHTLYCATDDGDYRQFVDAFSRCHAVLLLGIEQEQLKTGLQRLVFGRYSAHYGYFGKATGGYEIREFGQVLTHLDNWDDLCDFAQQKEKRA